MATDWHISGEAGKGWDATARPLAYMNVAGGSVSTGSWDADKASFRLVSDSKTLSGLLVPDLEQRVELRRSASASDVHFRGWVTGRRVAIGAGGLAELAVEVSGAWYWMRKAAVVTQVKYQHALAAANRAQIMTGGDARNSIATLVNIAQATYPGRIYSHSMGATYELPQITISDTDTAAAIADLLRWLPDASAWWDYPASQTGNIFRLARRASLSTVTLALDGSSGVVSAEFNPRADQANSEGVTVDYAEVITANTPDCGKINYLTQGSGAGRVRVTAAGPELDTYVPDAPAESTTLTTRALTAANFLADHGSAKLKAAIAANQNGGIMVGSDGLKIVDETTGEKLSGSWYIATAGEDRDWLPQRGITTRRIKATLNYYSAAVFSELDLSTGKFTQNIKFEAQSYSCPIASRIYQTVGSTMLAWMNVAQSQSGGQLTWNAGTWLIQGKYVACPGIILPSLRFVERLEASGLAVNKGLSGATYYRPPDFDFVKPPATLAANLSAAQNWTPMEGQAVLATDSPGATSFAGKLLAVTGGPAEWAANPTPVVEHTIDLASARETVRTGAPARLGHLGIQTRIRRGGQDNIRWL